MAKVDLEHLSAQELHAHIAEAQAVLERKIQSERDEVIRKTEADLARLGLTLSDALRHAQAKPAKSRGKRQLAPKFRHPEFPETTWSGVGRKPAWIREAEEAGRLDDLRIAA